MESPSLPRLSQFSRPAKILCTGYLITLLIGYGVALLQVYDRSHFDMGHAVSYYRGDDLGEESVMLPQTYATMLSVTHVHTLSQPMMFSLLGLVFLFSAASQTSKSILISLVFAGSVLSNLAPWLIRYSSATMVYLLPFSQLMIAVGLLVMSARSFYELWFQKKSQL